jgi:very-short-patch-repair endonuclease
MVPAHWPKGNPQLPGDRRPVHLLNRWRFDLNLIPLPRLGGGLGRGVRFVVSRKARQLRNNPTEAEQKLWSHLRRKQLLGFRFRRQRPIGRYIVDFVCLEVSLIIEVDGGQHAEEIAKDEARTRFLERQGFRVVRFWNNDVLANTEEVLQAIWNELQNSPEDQD